MRLGSCIRARSGTGGTASHLMNWKPYHTFVIDRLRCYAELTWSTYAFPLAGSRRKKKMLPCFGYAPVLVNRALSGLAGVVLLISYTLPLTLFIRYLRQLSSPSRGSDRTPTVGTDLNGYATRTLFVYEARRSSRDRKNLRINFETVL